MIRPGIRKNLPASRRRDKPFGKSETAPPTLTLKPLVLLLVGTTRWKILAGYGRSVSMVRVPSSILESTKRNIPGVMNSPNLEVKILPGWNILRNQKITIRSLGMLKPLNNSGKLVDYENPFLIRSHGRATPTLTKRPFFSIFKLREQMPMMAKRITGLRKSLPSRNPITSIFLTIMAAKIKSWVRFSSLRSNVTTKTLSI